MVIPAPEPRAALVQYAHGDMHVRMLEAGLENNRRYCARWQARHIADRTPPRPDRAAHFEKIRVIKAAFAAGHEIVVWMDADCVIIDHATSIFATAVTELAICECYESPRQPRHYSTGVVVLRDGPATRAFLDAWDALVSSHPWADQQTFMLLMKEPRWRRLLTVLPNRFNMSPVNMEDPVPVILAAHGNRQRPGVVLDWLDAMRQGRRPRWDGAPDEPAIRRAALRYLTCEIDIASNDATLIDRLQQQAPAAEQHLPVTAHHCVACHAGPEGYSIDGRVVAPDGDGALATVMSRVSALVLAALPHHTALRAAIGSHRGRALLLAGEPGSGKTTLATSLLLAGIEMSGDETALLADGQALAVPRLFNLRQTSLALLPELDMLQGARLDRMGGMVFPIDPLTLGRPWRIAPAPVGAVFLIRPAPAGQTRLLPVSKVEMARYLTPLATGPGAGRALAAISAILASAMTAIIEVGSPASAAVAIRAALDELPAP